MAGKFSQILKCRVHVEDRIPVAGRKHGPLSSALSLVRVSFLAQNAAGNLFEWKDGIFVAKGPVSQPEGIIHRHTLALLKHLQHTPRQLCSFRHPS